MISGSCPYVSPELVPALRSARVSARISDADSHEDDVMPDQIDHSEYKMTRSA